MLAAVAAKVASTKLGFPSLAKPILTLADVRLPTSTVSHPKKTHVLGHFSRSYNPQQRPYLGEVEQKVAGSTSVPLLFGLPSVHLGSVAG